MHQGQKATNRSKQRRFMVKITDFGLKGLKKTARRNSRIGNEVNRILERIAHDPKIGRKLTSDLFGMRTVESADGKYRVIYELEDVSREVVVHAVGGRKHVYDDLARMLNRIMPHTGNRSFGG